jgi:hypothetical protein
MLDGRRQALGKAILNVVSVSILVLLAKNAGKVIKTASSSRIAQNKVTRQR